MLRKKSEWSLTIVIPAYNEEENLDWVTKNTIKVLPKYFKKFEIIIVDDGSKDKTGQIADRLANKHPSVRVLHQPNGGFSKAMLNGISASKMEFVAYMPADGQFLVEDMRYCFEVLKDSDLVLGYRGGRPDYTLKRMFMSYGYLMLLVILFGIKYMDVGWVNIWRTKKVKKLKLTGTSGIFILTEIVVKFMRSGNTIVEAPSFYHPRLKGEVKNAKFKVIRATFLNAMKLKLAISLGKKI